MHQLDFLANLSEELLNEDSSTLLDEIGVDSINVVEATLVELNRFIILMLEVFGDQCRELDRHELLLEDASVTDEFA